jgi:hypothetical protein
MLQCVSVETAEKREALVRQIRHAKGFPDVGHPSHDQIFSEVGHQARSEKSVI